MEAVAAAASIAGIITLVGQSIDGLIKFKEFFSDLTSASKTISRLLRDINSLIQVLRNVGDVLEQVEARNSKDKNLASLDIKLEDFSKDVHVWLATARILRPASETGGKAWLQKFRLAINSNAIQTIREEIGRHRQALCLSLAVLGRTIDLHTSQQIHQIGGKFDKAVSTTLSIHGAQEEALRRIEHYSKISMHSSANSIQSMDSIRTELSRLEAMITSSQSLPPSIVEANKSDSVPQNCAQSSTHESLPSKRNSLSGTIHKLDIHDTQPSRRVGPDDKAQYEHAMRSIEYQSLDEADHILDWPPENSKRKGYESSLLYTEFSKSPRLCSTAERHDFSGVLEFDHGNQRRRSSEDAYGQNLDIKHSGAFVEGEHDLGSDPTGRSLPTPEYLANNRSSSRIYSDNVPTTKPIETGYGALHNILQRSMAEMYPPPVVEYIALQQHVILYENYIKLHSERPSIKSRVGAKGKSPMYNTSTSPQPATLLQHGLTKLRLAVMASRKQCFQEGYLLSDIDDILFLPVKRDDCAPVTEGPPPTPKAEDINPQEGLPLRQDMHDVNVAEDLSSARVRINSWLLQSLQSDDSQAKLRKSILAEQNLTEEPSSSQVIKYWSVDEAATGVEIQHSLSAGAAGSHEGSSLESGDFYSCTSTD